jgi:hypothetical protein
LPDLKGIVPGLKGIVPGLKGIVPGLKGIVPGLGLCPGRWGTRYFSRLSAAVTALLTSPTDLSRNTHTYDGAVKSADATFAPRDRAKAQYVA